MDVASGGADRHVEVAVHQHHIADVVVDHGLQRFHPYAASSTLLDVEKLEVVRFGSCYEDIAYVLKRHFRVDLPARPR